MNIVKGQQEFDMTHALNKRHGDISEIMEDERKVKEVNLEWAD